MPASNAPEVNKPLPPIRDDMVLATPDMFLHDTPESWRLIPEFPAQFLRETNIAARTDGSIGVEMLKANPDVAWTGSPWHMHHFDWSVAYITKGWAEFEFEGVGVVRFEAGMIMNQPANNRHREGATSLDFEAIQVHSPAIIPTTVFLWDEDSGAYLEIRVDDPVTDTEFAAMNGSETVA